MSVRYMEIVITRKIYTQLDLTFKKDKFGSLVFARSNFSSNSITNSLSGCYPLYILGYDSSGNVYQCIEFDLENEQPTKYSDYLKNIIEKKIKTFYERVLPKTPIIIYYRSTTLLSDFGITTEFRTRLDQLSKRSFDIGYTIRKIKERDIFKWMEYSISHYMDYNAYYKPDINHSISFLTSKLSNPALEPEPTPIYHYAVTIQGSPKLQIELTATPCEDGRERITVDGPQAFLDAYHIPPNSNFIGFRQIPYSIYPYSSAALENLLPEEHQEHINNIKDKMMKNAKFVLFLTSTVKNAAENANDAEANQKETPVILERAAPQIEEPAEAPPLEQGGSKSYKTKRHRKKSRRSKTNRRRGKTNRSRGKTNSRHSKTNRRRRKH